MEQALRMVQPVLDSAPTGFAQWLSALDFALGEPKEIAIVGEAGADQLLDAVFSQYRPNQAVAFAPDGKESPIPLLAGRSAIDGHATAYVSRNFVCLLPVTEAEGLEGQLKG